MASFWLNTSQSARPIPDVPQVTIATLFMNSLTAASFLVEGAVVVDIAVFLDLSSNGAAAFGTL